MTGSQSGDARPQESASGTETSETRPSADGTTGPAPDAAGERPRIRKPAIPDRSPADSDASWGERAEPDDDERLRGDRPPHWDSP